MKRKKKDHILKQITIIKKKRKKEKDKYCKISLKQNTNKKPKAHRYKEQIGASSGGDGGLAKWVKEVKRYKLSVITACRLQCWEISGQTTSRERIQPYLSADRLPIKSS